MLFFGSLTSSIGPLISKDNTTIIKEPEKIHQSLLLMFWRIFLSAKQNLRWHDCQLISKIELTIKQINTGRVLGLDGLLVELLKVKRLSMLYSISSQSAEMGFSLANDWVGTALACLYKGKGEKGICDYYHEITLLDTFGSSF